MINDYIYKTPEQEGLSSKYINKLLSMIEDYKFNLHSFMIVRHGNIISEGYYKPFHKDFMHRQYSSSKTYVSMAIGKLVGEGKIRLTDRLADYFPEYADESLDKWRRETTIEDALKMSVPMLTDTYFDRKYKEWAWTFFNRQTTLKPSGTIYNYNTSASFILDVLVEKLTGKPFLEYLRPEFDEIGVSKDIWCVKAPDGFSWGGSGVVCTMRDYAKLAELIMHKGECKGKQLLPRDYVEKATSKQISNHIGNNYDILATAGYGYQTWITKGGFALRGMGTQEAFCFPDKDFMVVFNGDTQSPLDVSSKQIFGMVYYCLYENLGEPLKEDKEEYAKLRNRIDNLELFSDFGEKHVAFEKQVDGVRYELKENSMGWKWFKLDLEGDIGILTYENARGEKQIKFGLGHYEQGTFPETNYYDRQVDTPSNRELNAMYSANWTEEKKLMIRAYITDTSLGNCFMTFGFKDDEVGIQLVKRAEFFMDGYEGYAMGSAEK